MPQLNHTCLPAGLHFPYQPTPLVIASPATHCPALSETMTFIKALPLAAARSFNSRFYTERLSKCTLSTLGTYLFQHFTHQPGSLFKGNGTEYF